MFKLNFSKVIVFIFFDHRNNGFSSVTVQFFFSSYKRINFKNINENLRFYCFAEVSNVKIIL